MPADTRTSRALRAIARHRILMRRKTYSWRLSSSRRAVLRALGDAFSTGDSGTKADEAGFTGRTR